MASPARPPADAGPADTPSTASTAAPTAGVAGAVGTDPALQQLLNHHLMTMMLASQTAQQEASQAAAGDDQPLSPEALAAAQEKLQAVQETNTQQFYAQYVAYASHQTAAGTTPTEINVEAFAQEMVARVTQQHAAQLAHLQQAADMAKLADATPPVRSSKKTPEQTRVLEAHFAANNFPSREEQIAIGKQVGLEFNQVENWFGYRRQRARKAEEQGTIVLPPPTAVGILGIDVGPATIAPAPSLPLATATATATATDHDDGAHGGAGAGRRASKRKNAGSMMETVTGSDKRRKQAEETRAAREMEAQEKKVAALRSREAEMGGEGAVHPLLREERVREEARLAELREKMEGIKQKSIMKEEESKKKQKVVSDKKLSAEEKKRLAQEERERKRQLALEAKKAKREQASQEKAKLKAKTVAAKSAEVLKQSVDLGSKKEAALWPTKRAEIRALAARREARPDLSITEDQYLVREAYYGDTLDRAVAVANQTLDAETKQQATTTTNKVLATTTTAATANVMADMTTTTATTNRPPLPPARLTATEVRDAIRDWWAAGDASELGLTRRYLANPGQACHSGHPIPEPTSRERALAKAAALVLDAIEGLEEPAFPPPTVPLGPLWGRWTSDPAAAPSAAPLGGLLAKTPRPLVVVAPSSSSFSSMSSTTTTQPPPFSPLLPISGETVGRLHEIHDICMTFRDVLGLGPFSRSELASAFATGQYSTLLSDIAMSLLQLLQADCETAQGASLQNPAAVGRPTAEKATISAASNLLLESWAWGFDTEAWRAHLSTLTWPEVLRQVGLACGWGVARKKARPLNATGVVQDEIEHPSLPGLVLRVPPELTVGTVKYAVWQVLSTVNGNGLKCDDILERMEELQLRKFAGKTPKITVSCACREGMQAGFFFKIKPGVFALKEVVEFCRGGKVPDQSVTEGRGSGRAKKAKKLAAEEEARRRDLEARAAEEKQQQQQQQQKDGGEEEGGVGGGGDDGGGGDGVSEIVSRRKEWVEQLLHQEFDDLSIDQRVSCVLDLCYLALEMPSLRNEVADHFEAEEELGRSLAEIARQEKIRKSEMTALIAPMQQHAKTLQIQSSFAKSNMLYALDPLPPHMQTLLGHKGSLPSSRKMRGESGPGTEDVVEGGDALGDEGADSDGDHHGDHVMRADQDQDQDHTATTTTTTPKTPTTTTGKGTGRRGRPPSSHAKAKAEKPSHLSDADKAQCESDAQKLLAEAVRLEAIDAEAEKAYQVQEQTVLASAWDLPSMRNRPLGEDRQWNRYWVLRESTRHAVLAVEPSDGGPWAVVPTLDALAALEDALQPAGTREGNLLLQLRAVRPELERGFAARAPDRTLDHPDALRIPDISRRELATMLEARIECHAPEDGAEGGGGGGGTTNHHTTTKKATAGIGVQDAAAATGTTMSPTSRRRKEMARREDPCVGEGEEADENKKAVFPSSSSLSASFGLVSAVCDRVRHDLLASGISLHKHGALMRDPSVPTGTTTTSVGPKEEDGDRGERGGDPTTTTRRVPSFAAWVAAVKEAQDPRTLRDLLGELEEQIKVVEPAEKTDKTAADHYGTSTHDDTSRVHDAFQVRDQVKLVVGAWHDSPGQFATMERGQDGWVGVPMDDLTPEDVEWAKEIGCSKCQLSSKGCRTCLRALLQETFFAEPERKPVPYLVASLAVRFGWQEQDDIDPRVGAELEAELSQRVAEREAEEQTKRDAARPLQWLPATWPGLALRLYSLDANLIYQGGTIAGGGGGGGGGVVKKEEEEGREGGVDHDDDHKGAGWGTTTTTTTTTTTLPREAAREHLNSYRYIIYPGATVPRSGDLQAPAVGPDMLLRNAPAACITEAEEAEAAAAAAAAEQAARDAAEEAIRAAKAEKQAIRRERERRQKEAREAKAAEAKAAEERRKAEAATYGTTARGSKKTTGYGDEGIDPDDLSELLNDYENDREDEGDDDEAVDQPKKGESDYEASEDEDLESDE